MSQLKELDDEVTELRKSLVADKALSKESPSAIPESPSKKATTYEQLLASLDTEKAKRLLNARRKTVETLKKLQNAKVNDEPTG